MGRRSTAADGGSKSIVDADILEVMETIATSVSPECTHQDLRFLGSGPGVTYERCGTCGAIFIEQAGRSWIFRQTAGQA